MIRVGLIGCYGRMGQAFTDFAGSKSDMEICAAIDQDDNVASLTSSNPDVALDLSLGVAVRSNSPEIIKARIPYVIGATGIEQNTLNSIAELATEHSTAVLVVPNFSIGAILMMKFAQATARFMEWPVITERHHDGKADAPSGTALHTAELVNAQMAESDGAQCNYIESCNGVMGGMIGNVRLHSCRGSGYLAEQAVQFSLPGETLNIEHRSIDRRCFMAGIEYAIRNIGKVKGLQVGLDRILDL